MRKNYFLLLVCLFTIALFGQTKIYNYIEEDYIGPGNYEKSNKTDYIYNPDNTLAESRYYFWDTSTVPEGWTESYKQLFTDYDVNGNLKEQVFQTWNGSQWINAWKEVRVFNGDNNPTLFTYYDGNGSVWVEDTQTTVTYLSATVIDRVSDYTWNGSTFVEDERYSYNYISNKLDNAINITWDGSQWINSEKTIYTYYGNGKIEKILYQDWVGGQWVDYDEDTYVLDNNFNRKTETYFLYSIGSDQDLIEYNYDTALLLSSFTHPFNNDKFIYSLGIENNPYVNKILTEVTSSYNGVDWDIVSRKTYNYDNTAGVNDFNDSQIIMYPNPTSGFVYLSNINKKLDYKVYDVTGKISMEGKINTDNKIDLSNLKSGLFFLKLKTETGNIIHRKVLKN